MEVLRLIERVEKNRHIGRVDKTSAIAFINDALFEVSKRQALFVTENIPEFTESPIQLNGVLIKLQSVKFAKGDFRLQLSPNGVINVLIKKDEYGREWKIIEASDDINVSVDVTYIGYMPVRNLDGENSTIDVPEYLQTAIVYYVLSKMFEERGDYEQSAYFMQQYSREFMMKPSPRRDAVGQPSEYSLL